MQVEKISKVAMNMNTNNHGQFEKQLKKEMEKYNQKDENINFSLEPTSEIKNFFKNESRQVDMLLSRLEPDDKIKEFFQSINTNISKRTSLNIDIQQEKQEFTLT